MFKTINYYMKKLLLFLFLLILTIVSCKQFKVSEKEKAAMKEIVELYGGSCTYTINFKVSTKSGKTRSFEREVSNSEFLNEHNELAEMYASNIAYIFFTYVKDEKKTYNNIKSSIIYKDGGKASYNYSFDSLRIVDTKMAYVKNVVKVLADSGLEKTKQMIKPGIFRTEEDKQEYFAKLIAIDPTFGKIIDFKPVGFKFITNNPELNFLHISGNLKRSKRDSQFSIGIEPTIGLDKVYILGFDY